MYSRDDVLRLVTEQVHHPATARELAQLLIREERAGFKRQLKTLVADGVLLQIRGNRSALPSGWTSCRVGSRHTRADSASSCLTTGTSALRSPDVYVAAANLMDAMHGDRVVARIERQRDGAPRGV